MWEKLSNSSLLFSKTYHKYNKELYENTPFIDRLYNYFINKGFYNLIYSQIINILISNFIVFFILFLTNCVDFKTLIKLDSESNIKNYIDISELFNINYFAWILLIFFYIITIMKIISISDDIYVYSNIKDFYKNYLEISDNQLEYLEWNDIINVLSNKTDEKLDIFYLNNIISAKSNYFIGILENNIINCNILNKLMEWNLYFCIFFTIFDNYRINGDIFTEKDKYSIKIKQKMKWISVLNFIFMPFILTLLLFYYIFCYGELFYNKPQLVISKGFSNREKWRLKYYNELDHEFYKRMEYAEKKTTEYIYLFKNNIFIVISRLFVFLLSSIFIVILILSIINDKILTNLYIFNDKPLIWILGIITPIIAIARGYTIIKEKRNPECILNELSSYIYLDEKDIHDAYTNDIFTKISKTFEYKATLFLKDIYSIILTPFQLWKLSYESTNIIEFILQNTKPHNTLKFICSISDFEKYETLDLESNSKQYISYKIFLERYTKWHPNNTTNVNINII